MRSRPGRAGPVKPAGQFVPDERLTWHGSPFARARLRHGGQAGRLRWGLGRLGRTRGHNSDGPAPGERFGGSRQPRPGGRGRAGR
jgi:hypothetical protein